MASHPLFSPDVELRESEIARPQPLRIIKRSQTISGSTASGETLRTGRGPSSSSEISRGSPPHGHDRPLTVHKIRKGRARVTDGSFDGPSDIQTGSAIANLINKQAGKDAVEDDPEVTPKARPQVPRTMSAGAFLKTELHRESMDVGRFSMRGNRRSMATSDVDYMHHIPESMRNPDGSPKIPERRLSKSKNFLMRAIGGRSANPDKTKPNPIKKAETSSRNTLARRISRNKNRVPTPWGASSASESTSPSGSFGPASFDIADVGINSRLSSSYGGTPPTSYGSDAVLSIKPESSAVLCPQITVTPEVSSVDIGNSVFWVAVEITGVLRGADNSQAYHFQRDAAGPMNSQLSGLWRYGSLHSMNIDIQPPHKCFVTELVGDVHDSSPLRAGETRLILAKISLCQTISSSHITESSSDELMANLERDLGNTLASYLTVRLTYKHSGFLNYTSPVLLSAGMSSHTTLLHTEANAVIKRHNSQSAWSPRTSQTLNAPIVENPLLGLIKLHLQPDKAEEAMSKVNNVERPISFARRSAGNGGSSEETVKPFTNVISPPTSSTVSASLVNALPKCSSMSHLPTNKQPVGPFARLPSPLKTDDEEMDPARKIWNEMRRTSRSCRVRPHQGRTSISADHFYSVDESPSPTRNSSSDATSSTIDTTRSESFVPEYRPFFEPAHDIEHERIRIKDIALRNKRSLGADTLRSIAPSIKSKSKGGTIGGLGLGVGRSWGWGSPWW